VKAVGAGRSVCHVGDWSQAKHHHQTSQSAAHPIENGTVHSVTPSIPQEGIASQWYHVPPAPLLPGMVVVYRTQSSKVSPGSPACTPTRATRRDCTGCQR
jgi:hypothetical protein